MVFINYNQCYISTSPVTYIINIAYLLSIGDMTSWTRGTFAVILNINEITNNIIISYNNWFADNKLKYIYLKNVKIKAPQAK